MLIQVLVATPGVPSKAGMSLSLLTPPPRSPGYPSASAVMIWVQESSQSRVYISLESPATCHLGAPGQSPAALEWVLQAHGQLIPFRIPLDPPDGFTKVDVYYL